MTWRAWTAGASAAALTVLAACGGGPQSAAGSGGRGGGAIGGMGGSAAGGGGAAQGGIGGAGTGGASGSGGASGVGANGSAGSGATGVGGFGGGGAGGSAGGGADGGGVGGGGGIGGACTPGDDKGCNEDPALTTARGYCGFDRMCNCGTGAKSAFTGRCLDPGDDGSGCEYGGTSYGVGNVVPVLGCADRCSCTGPGVISCPSSACVPCVFAEDYSFRLPDPDGTLGFLSTQNSSSLVFVRMRPGSDVAVRCSAPLPARDTPNAVDASDIIADIADGDVQLALATAPRPFYGDSAASGAPTFTFMETTGGGGFSVVVGHECPTATATCEPTPMGVARLVNDVNAAVSAALSLCTTWQ